jgi:hypothetical protein
MYSLPEAQQISTAVPEAHDDDQHALHQFYEN